MTKPTTAPDEMPKWPDQLIVQRKGKRFICDVLMQKDGGFQTYLLDRSHERPVQTGPGAGDAEPVAGKLICKPTGFESCECVYTYPAPAIPHAPTDDAGVMPEEIWAGELPDGIAKPAQCRTWFSDPEHVQAFTASVKLRGARYIRADLAQSSAGADEIRIDKQRAESMAASINGAYIRRALQSRPPCINAVKPPAVEDAAALDEMPGEKSYIEPARSEVVEWFYAHRETIRRALTADKTPVQDDLMAMVRELVEARKKATAGEWTREKPGKTEDGWQKGVVIAQFMGGQRVYSEHLGGQFPSSDADFIRDAANIATRMAGLQLDSVSDKAAETVHNGISDAQAVHNAAPDVRDDEKVALKKALERWDTHGWIDDEPGENSDMMEAIVSAARIIAAADKSGENDNG